MGSLIADRKSLAGKQTGSGSSPPGDEPPNGGDGGNPPGPGPVGEGGSGLTNAQLAMMVFIAAEVMFFAGLVAAFFVFRFGGQPWPPPTLPRLPVTVTAVNTGFLLLSSFTMSAARRAIARGDSSALLRGLAATGVLGVLFLAIQGFEWVRLLQFGLTVSSGTYGSTFYVIIGTHAAHVMGGGIWLLAVLIRAGLGRYTAGRHTEVQTLGIYWHLVVGLWPFLFVFVYLI